MNRTARPLLTALCLLAAATPGFAADGLKVDLESSLMPRWQVRLALAGPSMDGLSRNWNTALPRSAARLTSDYYFDRRGIDGSPGGLRATGALLFGPQGLAMGAPAPVGTGSVLVRTSTLSSEAFDSSADSSAATPYFGLGYSAGWAKMGLNVSADLGLMGAGSNVRLGRSYGGAAAGDDPAHDWRLTPVLQLNLSYSF